MRILTLGIALLITVLIIGLLPPGMSQRFSSGIRYVTHPAQTWSDFSARVVRAAVGNDSDNSENKEEIKSSELQNALRQTQVELAACQASLAALAQDVRQFGRALEAYQPALTLAGARVIKRDPLVSYYDSIVIDRGSNDGVQIGQYVVACNEGPTKCPVLVGVIRDVAATSANVMLITHSETAVACSLPTRRIAGVLTGAVFLDETREGQPAISRIVSKLIVGNPIGASCDAIKEGDAVYTSAAGDNDAGVPGIWIGTVEAVDQRIDGTPEIQVTPGGGLGQLSHVWVVLKANAGMK